MDQVTSHHARWYTFKRQTASSCLAALIAFAALVPPAFAKDWRKTQWPLDTLSYEEAKDLTSDRVLTFPGLGQSTYFDDGSYAFKREGQTEVRIGAFKIRRDGRVCVDFQPNSSRCDVFMKDRGLLFLMTEEGDKFPVHFKFEFR